MKMLPQRRSSGWLWWMLAYGTLLSLLLGLNRFIAAGKMFEANIALRFALLAFALSIAVNVFGWFGARWVWGFTTLGILAGVVLMFVYASRDMSGWEDLASFLAFAEGVVIGFALGLLAEGVQWLLKRRRRK
ncbi:hypothetical protein FE784_11105 [Paenibacillus hemerocallicola]|uniref:Uncharacterized protein n=1 Tax=Paenibacillus hemerocallicola TaxID=1172614 RepID=A0A5C4TBC7_9BACL|nr:hypothetical protein [Paenibacillus hemerocallicola]TNJ66215.1 hypothetical protein FE784_11105 [Paenibacillus hemerocallicola]